MWVGIADFAMSQGWTEFSERIKLSLGHQTSERSLNRLFELYNGEIKPINYQYIYDYNGVKMVFLPDKLFLNHHVSLSVILLYTTLPALIIGLVL